MDLNLIWFVLLGVLLIGYAILDGFDLAIGRLDHPLKGLLDELVAGLAQTILVGDAGFHELPSTDDQGVKLPLLRGGWLAGGRGCQPGELGEHGGVEPIRLRLLADAASEVANLSRVDQRHRQSGVLESPQRRPFVPAGRFEDDGGRTLRAEPSEELLAARRVVGELAQFPAGKQAAVEFVLRDVDADETPRRRLIRFVHVPVLRMRARRPALATVRANETRPQRITLGDGVRSAGTQSISRRPPLLPLRSGRRRNLK